MLIEILVSLVILGLLLWVIDQLPLSPDIKRIIHVVVIVFVVLWLLRLFIPGGFGHFGPLSR